MKAMNIVKTAVWIAFLAGISIAGVKRVFVADVGISASASAKITPEEITLVTKSLRGEAVNNLPPGEYEIMTKETVIAQGGAAPNICDSVECVITIGSKIGADFIARGTINKIRTMFALTVEIHETENGNLVASSELVRSENIVELIEKGAKACADMYKTFANMQRSVPQSQQQQTAYTITATANPNNGGYVSRNPDQTYYTPGTYVNVMAVPADGYKFTGWSGDATDKTDIVMLTMDGDKTLTANFQYIQQEYTLKTTVSPQGGGYITRIPNKETYAIGEEVIVTATPIYGYTFTGWTGTGAISGRAPRLTVTMDGDMALLANFYLQSISPSTAPKPDAGVVQSRAAKPRRTGVSVGVGALYAGGFGGGIVWSDGQVTMPYSGGGAYLFLSHRYASAHITYLSGGGRWESDNNYGGNYDLPEARRIDLNVGIFGKYPITLWENITAFPIAGFDYSACASARLVRADGSKYTFDGMDGRRHVTGDLNELWMRIGAGADVDISWNTYIHGEFLYGARLPNAFEQSYLYDGGYARLGHGLMLRVGAGVRL